MTRGERGAPPGRQGAVRSAILLALAGLLAACAAPSTSPSGPTPTTGTLPAGPTRICDDGPAGEVPPISCTEAIGQVLVSLGQDARSVQAAWFRPGAPCPPNARCIAPAPGSAYVVLRLEGAQIHVVPMRIEGDVVVGAPDEPTFDIWPSTGESAPAPAAPDMGPGVPEEIALRDPLPLCVDERRPQVVHPARACFFEAVLDGRQAELVIRTVDQAGDPVVELYRYSGRGPVLVYRSPNPAGPGWIRSDCAIGSAFDDELIFVVSECLSTELS